MEKFLNEIVEWKKFELLIDSSIFNKDIVLKSAYNFLDKGYFFFKYDTGWNLILQFTTKDWIEDSPNSIINNFGEELIAVYLRDKLEKDNKVIRETIVEKAIGWPIDLDNFVSLDTDAIQENQENNQIDFDKDIDDILKEIESDPDLKIDENEIENILKEIEEETEEIEKPKLTINPDAVKEAKNNFKK